MAKVQGCEEGLVEQVVHIPYKEEPRPRSDPARGLWSYLLRFIAQVSAAHQPDVPLSWGRRTLRA
jgi:hypothetical protein